MSEHDPPEAAASKKTTQEKIEAEIDAYLQKIQEAQASAIKARQEANKTADPEEKNKLLDDAEKQDKLAANQLKTIKSLQSGLWVSLRILLIED